MVIGIFDTDGIELHQPATVCLQPSAQCLELAIFHILGLQRGDGVSVRGGWRGEYKLGIGRDCPGAVVKFALEQG